MSRELVEKLQSGLLLEDSGVVLPWGATRSAIEALVAPSRTFVVGAHAILTFEGCDYLGGLSHPIQITFRDYEPDEFREARAEVAAWAYPGIKDHLAQAFGAPHEENGESVCYQLGRVTVAAHVWDHFGERCTLLVTGFALE